MKWSSKINSRKKKNKRIRLIKVSKYNKTNDLMMKRCFKYLDKCADKTKILDEAEYKEFGNLLICTERDKWREKYRAERRGRI